MKFIYEKPLLDYMNKKKKNIIIVEVCTSDSSDFEVTELHVHLITEKQADFFTEKKKFHRIETESGAVLLPNYKLEYDETITFGLKTFWMIHTVSQKGIRL